MYLVKQVFMKIIDQYKATTVDLENFIVKNVT